MRTDAVGHYQIDAAIRVELALGVVQTCRTGKGGADNAYIEWLFSICRMLGLRPTCVSNALELILHLDITFMAIWWLFNHIRHVVTLSTVSTAAPEADAPRTVYQMYADRSPKAVCCNGGVAACRSTVTLVIF